MAERYHNGAFEPCAVKRYIESKTIEHTGALPITINTDGNALLDYRIYGADGGVGDRTENLFDIKTAVMGEYWIDDTKNTFTWHAGSKCYFIPAIANTSYTVTAFTKILPSGTFVFRAAFTNEIPTAHASNIGATYLKQRINSTGGSKHTATLTNVNYAYLAVQVNASSEIHNNVVISEGSTAPAEYVPYGYEVDMSVSDGTTSTTIPIYIGPAPLGEDEYVDYGEQKVYKRTANIFNGQIERGYYAFANGARDSTSVTAQRWVCTTLKACKGDTEYGIRVELSNELSSRSYGVVWFDSSQNFISSKSFNTLTNPVIFDVISPSFAEYFVINIAATTFDMAIEPSKINDITIVEDSTAPEQYIPYLMTTDPPVPLPEIPTADGTTIIDYDGTPKPSQTYIKYNSWSGWEPCTEYVRRNGVWVQQT